VFELDSGASVLADDADKRPRTTTQLAANEKTTIKTKLKRAKRKQLVDELEEDRRAKVRVKAVATGQSGTAATDKVKVKLKA
jgi:hypothetical protein